MKTWLSILTAVVVLLSVAVGVVALRDCAFDPNGSAGVFISALGVLVTFVVAWQVWMMIDAKNALMDAVKIREELRRDVFRQCADLLIDTENLYMRHGDYLFHAFAVIRRITALSKAGDYESCNEAIRSFCYCSSSDNGKSADLYKELHKLTNKIPNQDKISEMTTLRKRLNSLFPCPNR